MSNLDFILSKSDHIFLEGNVPSLKNSKQIVRPKGRGYPSLVPAKRCQEYARSLSHQLYSQHPKWKNMQKSLLPLDLLFIFVRKDRRAFDFSNAVQVLEDCLSGSLYNIDKYIDGKGKLRYIPEELKIKTDFEERMKWIVDDNHKHFVPHFFPEVFYDKERPGVYLIPIHKITYEFFNVKESTSPNGTDIIDSNPVVC